jgi:hypothetical protein
VVRLIEGVGNVEIDLAARESLAAPEPDEVVLLPVETMSMNRR